MAALVLGVSGISGAGKSTFAEHLCTLICGLGCLREKKRGTWDYSERWVSAACERPRVSILRQDKFHKSTTTIPYDNPKHINFDRARAALLDECRDEKVDCVIFEGFLISPRSERHCMARYYDLAERASEAGVQTTPVKAKWMR